MARGTRKRARFRKSDRCSSFCSTKRATIVGRIDFLVSLFSIVSSLQENSWGEKLCDSLRSDINLIFILGADSVDSSHLVELYYWGGNEYDEDLDFVLVSRIYLFETFNYPHYHLE